MTNHEQFEEIRKHVFADPNNGDSIWLLWRVDKLESSLRAVRDWAKRKDCCPAMRECAEEAEEALK